MGLRAVVLNEVCALFLELSTQIDGKIGQQWWFAILTTQSDSGSWVRMVTVCM
jgi:hypothetical protein